MGTQKETPPVFVTVDAGTDGLSILALDRQSRELARATAGYDQQKFIPDLPDGAMQQYPRDWEMALKRASASLWRKLRQQGVLIGKVFIGLAGQMHGLVRRDQYDQAPDGAPLWCDDGDAGEAAELTKLFGFKVPQRVTISRWLGRVRQDPAAAKQCQGIITPTGWLFYKLTGQWAVGIGEASGMFPVDPMTGTFDRDMLVKFDQQMVKGLHLPYLRTLLPSVHRAGSFIGELTSAGAKLIGAPIGSKVAPPEGDQQGALTGSLIFSEGDGALSVGTSIVLNVLSDRSIGAISPTIDHFVDANGRRFRMIWVKNGTTFLNLWMELFRQARNNRKIERTFAAMMPSAEQVARECPDCGGLMGLPFLINEPGAGFAQAGVPLLTGMTESNFTPGQVLHLAFLLPMFGLSNGLDDLHEEGVTPNQLVVTGGIAQSPDYAGPVIASVTGLPVFIPEEATEGTAYGAGLLAIFAYRRQTEPGFTYERFLAEVAGERRGTSYRPDPELSRVYEEMRRRFNDQFDVGRLLLGTLTT